MPCSERNNPPPPKKKTEWIRLECKRKKKLWNASHSRKKGKCYDV